MKYKTTASLVLLLCALALIGAGAYLAYLGGCVFDSKQGFGDLELANRYTEKNLLSLSGAWLFFSAGLSVRSGLTLSEVIKAALLAAIMVFPVWFIFSFEAEIKGTQTCHPT